MPSPRLPPWATVFLLFLILLTYSPSLSRAQRQASAEGIAKIPLKPAKKSGNRVTGEKAKTNRIARAEAKADSEAKKSKLDLPKTPPATTVTDAPDRTRVFKPENEVAKSAKSTGKPSTKPVDNPVAFKSTEAPASTMVSDSDSSAKGSVPATEVASVEARSGSETAGKDNKGSSNNTLPIALGVSLSLVVLAALVVFFFLLPGIRKHRSKRRDDSRDAAIENFTALTMPRANTKLIKGADDEPDDMRFSLASTLGGGARRSTYDMNGESFGGGEKELDSQQFPDPPMQHVSSLPPLKQQFVDSKDLSDATLERSMEPRQGSYKSSLTLGLAGEIE